MIRNNSDYAVVRYDTTGYTGIHTYISIYHVKKDVILYCQLCDSNPNAHGEFLLVRIFDLEPFLSMYGRHNYFNYPFHHENARTILHFIIYSMMSIMYSLRQPWCMTTHITISLCKCYCVNRIFKYPVVVYQTQLFWKENVYSNWLSGKYDAQRRYFILSPKQLNKFVPWKSCKY